MAEEHGKLGTELLETGMRNFTQWRSSYKKISRDFENDGAKIRRDYSIAHTNWRKVLSG